MESATTVTAEEIREDFAQRLQRRMSAMQASASCRCGTSNDEHRSGCEKYGWIAARRVIELMLGECNGEEGINVGT